MRRVILLLFCLCLLCGTAFADSASEQQVQALQPDSLYGGLNEDADSLLRDRTPLESGDFLSGVRDVFSGALDSLTGSLPEICATFGLTLAIVILCSLVAPNMDSVSRVGALAGTLALSAVCIGSCRGAISEAVTSVQDMITFSNAFLPVMSAAGVASGAATQSTGIYVVSVLFCDVLLTLAQQLLIPLLYLFLSLSIADAALGNRILKQMKELFLWVIKTGMKVILAIFTGFLTLTQIISGTADSMTLRAAKLTLSGTVPVVGGMISDASETVLVSAGLLKSSIGVFGMLAILATCIVPFLQIGAQYLFMRLSFAVSSMLDDGPYVGFLSDVSKAMELLLGLCGVCAVVLLISAVCSIKAVGF